MNKTELIQHLYDEINRQDSHNMAVIGILVTLIVFTVGFYSYQQYKLSDKQVSKIKTDVRTEFNDKLMEIQKITNSHDLRSYMATIDLLEPTTDYLKFKNLLMGAYNFSKEIKNEDEIEDKAYYSFIVTVGNFLFNVINEYNSTDDNDIKEVIKHNISWSGVAVETIYNFAMNFNYEDSENYSSKIKESQNKLDEYMTRLDKIIVGNNILKDRSNED